MVTQEAGLISFETLTLFFITTLIVVLSPGPAALAAAAEGASSGFKKSMLVVLGIASANVVYFILSATGIAALIIASHTLFTVIKWVGIAYLLYLGFSAIFSRSGPLSISPDGRQPSKWYKRFLKGFIIEISNPKALLYFSALLPQFIDISNPVIPQLAVLCIITIFLDISCYCLYGYLGFKSMNRGVKPFLAKIINRSAGCMLILAGFKMASVQQ